MTLFLIPKSLRRHKRKVYIAVFLITGGYLAIKWAIRTFKNNYLLHSKQKYLCVKKIEHFTTIQQTADEATFPLLKSLNDSIKKCLNSERLLEELKQKPKNKLEIWEQLKIMCITRCLSSSYAISILILYIRTILNIIGGYMYLISSSKSNKLKIHLSQFVQQKLLENIELFIKNGIPKLVNKFNEHVEKHFKDIPLKQNFTINYIETKLKEILRGIELSKEFYFKPNKPPNLSDFINDSDNEMKFEIDDDFILKINDFNFITVYLFDDFYLNQFNRNNDEFSNSKEEDEILKRLNIESFDVLSCDDCLLSFNSLQFYLFEFLINNLTQDMLQQTNRLNDDKTDGLIQIGIPFAKLIPLMDKIFDKLFNFQSNHLVHELLGNKILNTFSANIYESFSYSE